MATILIAHVHGKRIGRCDKRCYDAKGERCTCICNGANHGAGRHLARIHSFNDIDQIREDLAKGPHVPDDVSLKRT